MSDGLAVGIWIVFVWILIGMGIAVSSASKETLGLRIVIVLIWPFGFLGWIADILIDFIRTFIFGEKDDKRRD